MTTYVLSLGPNSYECTYKQIKSNCFDNLLKFYVPN